MNTIIEKNNAEIIFYAFQILSLFVVKSKSLDSSHEIIMSSLLTSKNNWNNSMRYLIPSLIEYARGFIIKSSSLPEHSLKGLTEIFSTVLSLHLDQHAFELLTTLTKKLNLEILMSLLNPVLIAIFQRMQQDKQRGGLSSVPPSPFANGALLFISAFINRFGYSPLKEFMDTIQIDIFFMVLKAMLPRIKALDGIAHVKSVLIALTKVLVQTCEFMDSGLFKALLNSLIRKLIFFFAKL
jgi:hypothetical protein